MVNPKVTLHGGRRAAIQALALALAGGRLGALGAAEPGVSRRALKLTIGFAPGTGPDFITRTLAPTLAEGWPAGAVVENRPGAGGALATAAVGVAPPDGTTLLYATVGEIAIWPHFQAKAAVEPAPLVPICQVTLASLQLLGGVQPGVATFSDLLRQSKDRDKLLVGTFGPGTPHHLAAVMIGEAVGRTTEPVHYRTPADMLADLAAGRIDASLASSTVALSALRAGKARVLGTSAPERPALFDDVPTFQEIGLARAEVAIWGGIFAPPGTSGELASRMEAAILAGASQPEFHAKLKESGVRAKPVPAQAFASLVAGDRERFGALVSRLNLKIT
jgi:tripartite-type tricarboxylate transporter receptor subunit TctC